MSSDVLLVEELAPELREAAIEIGFAETDTITPHGALRAWAQWNLGDPQWAEIFISLYKFPTGVPR